MNRTLVDLVELREFLTVVAPSEGYQALAEAYSDEFGVDVTAATMRNAVYKLRKAGETDWGADNDARLRQAALTTQLMRNAGRGFGEYRKHRYVQYLQAIDRRSAGLPEGGMRGAETFAADLLATGEVVDLREDGEPYRRPARAWEVGHLVAQAPPGEGA